MCFCPANSFLPIVMIDENRYTAFVDTKLCCESWQQQDQIHWRSNIFRLRSQDLL